MYCNVCKNKGNNLVSIDVSFGLCRKKSAGTSVHESLSGARMFYSQDDVN